MSRTVFLKFEKEVKARAIELMGFSKSKTTSQLAFIVE